MLVRCAVLYPDGKSGKILATSRREAYIKAFKKLTKEEQKKIVSDIDKQYEKVLSGDVKDIKESDMQVLALYAQNLKLSSDIMYKINKIIETRKLVSNYERF